MILLSFSQRWAAFKYPDDVPVGEMMNDGGWLVPVAVVSGIVGILGLIIGVSFHLDKKRREQWLEVATALGFQSLQFALRSSSKAFRLRSRHEGFL